MYHRLEFSATHWLDLQVRGNGRLEQVRIADGDIIEAHVRPYVQESKEGPMEVADLHLLHDGTLRAVPMEWFRFV